MSLENKTLLITGASDGIGKAVSMRAAAQGATVIIHGRNQPKLEKLYDDIVAQNYPEPVIYPLDLEKATPDDFGTMQQAIEKEFGELDGLINNAGWFGASTPVQHFDVSLWHRVIQVNLNAAFMLTQACLPLLNRASEASIIFTVDNKSTAYWGAYGVAKAGLIAFMQILNDETENTGIRVNAINPGTIRTSFRSRAFPGEDPGQHPLPETVAPFYIRLLGDEFKTSRGRIFELEKMDSK